MDNDLFAEAGDGESKGREKTIGHLFQSSTAPDYWRPSFLVLGQPPLATQMHHALCIEEILQEICHYLVFHDYQLNMSLVCRTFYDPGMDRLWGRYRDWCAVSPMS